MNYNKKRLIDDLIKRFKIEYDKNDRSGVYGYTQRKMAYNSNKIEGSTLTEDQTSSLFDTGTLSSDGELIRSKDIEEATGHFVMFNNMLKTFDEELSEDLIKKYHYDLKSGVFEDKANGYAIGDYKKRANTVSNIKVALPSEVSDKMKELLQEYNSKEKHSLKFAIYTIPQAVLIKATLFLCLETSSSFRQFSIIRKSGQPVLISCAGQKNRRWFSKMPPSCKKITGRMS